VKKLIRNIILIVLTTLLASGILWARHKAATQLCNNVDVQIVNADSTHYVTPQGVLNELHKLGINLEGKRMNEINASHIEEALGNSAYLEDVDCVKSQNGNIIIRARQLVPVLRVFDGNESYYVNKAGKRMTANSSYHADVPVVQGHFTKAYPATRLLPMVQYVENDTLLRSLVSMYCVRDTNNIIIVPNIDGHVVNMGNTQGVANKFAKLKLFYSEVMPNKGWLTYDTISVKWDHQVVATRRVKAVEVKMEYNPEDDEQMPDAETMTVGDDEAKANKATSKKQDKTQANADKQTQAKPSNDKNKKQEQTNDKKKKEQN